MPTPATLTRPRPPLAHFQPETATQLYARNLRRDPLGQLIAIATRHAGEGLPLSSRSSLSEGIYIIERGESPYLARRSFLRAVELRAGPNHPDYDRARQLVRALDEADTAAMGMAA